MNALKVTASSPSPHQERQSELNSDLKCQICRKEGHDVVRSHYRFTPVTGKTGNHLGGSGQSGKNSSGSSGGRWNNNRNENRNGGWYISGGWNSSGGKCDVHFAGGWSKGGGLAGGAVSPLPASQVELDLAPVIS